MNYWRKNSYDGLNSLIEEIKDVETLSEYSEYLINQEKGLRKLALRHLSMFLDAFKEWTVSDKRNFSDWILSTDQTNLSHLLLPHPLKNSAIKSCLIEWIANEPQNPIPRKWFGVYFHDLQSLEMARSLDPDDDLSRSKLASFILGDMDFACHHLPDYFIGDPVSVLNLSASVSDIISEIKNDDLRKYYADDLQLTSAMIHDWIECQSIAEENFAQWCINQGRKYPWIKGYHYK